jgi:hypothetical protein
MEYFTKIGTSMELISNSYNNRNSNVKVSNIEIENLIIF